MKYKKMIHTGLFFLSIGVSIIALLFVVTCTWIGYEVHDICTQAQANYPGDCVESTSTLVVDNKQSIKQRNRAIWALGQWGDQRALPVLQQLYTGIIPPREPLNKVISQYELKKAINLASGGTNITHFIWKHK
jgi:hypothetical protein